MLRVIQEIRPAWVVGENVAGIVSMALDQVLSDLEGIGYACQAFIIPACAVDATHRRDRCAIVANCNSVRLEASRPEQSQTRVTRSCENVANSNSERLQISRHESEIKEAEQKVGTAVTGRWSDQPGLGMCNDGISTWLAECRLRWADGTWEEGIQRTAKGVPHRVDKLKCLGNAVVPQQFYPIFKAIAEIEKMKHCVF